MHAILAIATLVSLIQLGTAQPSLRPNGSPRSDVVSADPFACQFLDSLALVVQYVTQWPSSFDQEKEGLPESDDLPGNSNGEAVNRNLISNGFPAQKGRYPWMVEIYNVGVDDHICGATLIHPQVLLSAAHCYYDGSINPNFPPRGSELKIGTFNKRTDRDDPPIGIIEAIKIPNTYVARRVDNRNDPDPTEYVPYDVLLILLKQPVDVDPVRIGYCPDLVYNSDDYFDVQNSRETMTELSLIGWGRNAQGNTPNILQECTALPARELIRGTLFNSEENRVLCVNSDPDKPCGARKGDSGGPVFIKGAKANLDLQLGVGSFGQGGERSIWASIHLNLPFMKATFEEWGIEDFPHFYKCDLTPENDKCEEAKELRVGAPPVVGSTVHASFEGNLPECGGIPGDSSPGIWYKVVGDGTELFATTCTGNDDLDLEFDSRMTVWKGNNCGQLQCIDGNDDDETDVCGSESGIKWQSSTGTRYHIHVSGLHRPVLQGYQSFGLQVTSLG